MYNFIFLFVCYKHFVVTNQNVRVLFCYYVWQLFTQVFAVCSESCDLLSGMASSTFKMLYVSHDLNSMAIPMPSNHVLLINIVDYFQVHMYKCILCSVHKQMF